MLVVSAQFYGLMEEIRILVLAMLPWLTMIECNGFRGKYLWQLLFQHGLAVQNALKDPIMFRVGLFRRSMHKNETLVAFNNYVVLPNVIYTAV